MQKHTASGGASSTASVRRWLGAHPKSASFEVMDCRLVRRMWEVWDTRCDVPNEAPLDECPGENEEVENLVRMKDAGNDDEPLEVFEHAAEGIKDAAPQKR